MLEQFFASREAAQEGAADKERNDSLKIAAVSDIGRDSEYETLSVSRTAEHTRAFMKVQDGCNQFCSYCIIPYARGRVRSRQMQDVIQEAERLSDNGCKEVVLTGIHLSSYGVDLSARRFLKGYDFIPRLF